MSSLIVEVTRVHAVERHPNADRMCVVTVKGWKVCAGRNPDTGTDEYRPGDLCVYIPPDCVLPPELSDRLNVTKYLSPLSKNDDGSRSPGGRVRVAHLRGEPSYGLIMQVPTADGRPQWPEGTDVAAILGVTKWEPPPERSDGEAEKEHPAFHRYCTIENYRNFPDLIPDGEEVVFTEKIHGKNCRLGLIRTTDETGASVMTCMAGSHDVRRKLTDARGRTSQFWQALTDNVKALLTAAAGARHDAVLFGEIYGSGVQDMGYGFDQGRWGFRAFDLTIDGKYVDYDRKAELFRAHNVEIVPFLYRGPFSRAKVEEFVSGPTTLCPVEQIKTSFKGREGVVVTPTRERIASTPSKVFDRVILKAISFEYLERKGGTEHH